MPAIKRRCYLTEIVYLLFFVFFSSGSERQGGHRDFTLVFCATDAVAFRRDACLALTVNILNPISTAFQSIALLLGEHRIDLLLGAER